jgi:hypothetical protein
MRTNFRRNGAGFNHPRVALEYGPIAAASPTGGLRYDGSPPIVAPLGDETTRVP